MRIDIHKAFTFSGHDAPVYALERFNENSFFSGGGDRLVSGREASENAAAIAIVNTGSTIYSILYLSEIDILLAGVMGGGIHLIEINHYFVLHRSFSFLIQFVRKLSLSSIFLIDFTSQ